MPARALVLGFLITVVTSWAAESPAKLASHSFTSEITLQLGYRYLLSFPGDYAEFPQKKWPLLVFLHGAGERGDDLELLKKHGPPKLIAQGRNFDAIVIAPQVPSGEFWNPHGVNALVEHLKRTQRVDEDRVYLTGISMGGFGTFDTITQYPNVFAAAIPICGGAGINVVKFAALKNLPIWIFHGAKDPTVPVQFSEMAAGMLKRLNAPHVKFTVYPEARHDSWTETYANPEVWSWLFAQRR